MKTTKTTAKKAAKPKAAAKPTAKKTAVAKKPAAPKAGLIKKLKNALSTRGSKPSAPSKLAAKAPAASKKTASSSPKSAAKPLAGKVQVQEKQRKPQAAAAVSPSAKTAVKPATKTVRSPAKRLPAGAQLTEDDIREMSDDEYMNETQLEFFRQRLVQMRQEVLQREMDVKERLHEREVFADPADRATAEEEHWLDLRLRERESLLLKKIDDALRRIEAKEYGYCEKTGDPIGIPRLLARPTATVCVDVKGQDERVEAQFRDR